MYMGYLRTLYEEEQLESKAKDKPLAEIIGWSFNPKYNLPIIQSIVLLHINLKHVGQY